MGFVRKHVDVWDGVFLHGHLLRDTLVSYLLEGVNVHNVLIASHRERSMGCPCNANKFQGAVFANHIPPGHAGFDAEMQSPSRKSKDVWARAGLERPRLIKALSVDTVARAANVDSEGWL